MTRNVCVLFLTAVCTLSPLAAAEPTLVLLQTIDLKGKAGKLDHVALDSKRQRLLVANKANNTLDVVDLKTGKLVQQVPGQAGIQGLAYVADLDRIFVGLGVRELSMSAGRIPHLKSHLRLYETASLQRLAQMALQCQSAVEVREFVNRQMSR